MLACSTQLGSDISGRFLYSVVRNLQSAPSIVTLLPGCYLTPKLLVSTLDSSSYLCFKVLTYEMRQHILGLACHMQLPVEHTLTPLYACIKS